MCSPQADSHSSTEKKIGIQPSADLGRELDRLAADRADVDRDLVADRVDVELQRLALAGDALALHQRQRVVLALVLEPALAGDDLLDDLDVLAGAAPGLRVGDAVPALGDLRAGGAEAEDEAAAREGVDRDAGHRRRGRGPRRDLEDRGAELDRLGLRREVGEHADRVGAVGLGRPDRVEAGASRRPGRSRPPRRPGGRSPSSRG